MRLSLLAAAVAAFCCCATADAAPRRYYGQVVDAGSGKPLANVRIRVFNQVDILAAALRAMPALPNATSPSLRKPKGYAQPAATVKSDANGRFALKVRDNGPSDLVCDGLGTGVGVRIANAAPDKFLEIRYPVRPKR